MSVPKSAFAEREIIKVTDNRQITIPLNFYEKLHFGKEAECILADDSIVIRPFAVSDESFAVEILVDLVAQGYSGKELIANFTRQLEHIQSAIDTALREPDEKPEGS
ncbi:MAG: AbrB/MazE/SpoVT family DNA-binding domain-containing protein [Oscillospiraceae bacterium]|jgi:bifunctional DNA-binding transcriptional regulator/antitoxin component of YhaV-PrlF toxin-antitoxin module|nr:AbrB/MazE/SpoVT family DNA-binding domain-containing protein [Oscillospiraceae bacterium]